MTHEDARQRAEVLNDQEQGARHWFVREREAGDFEVVAVAAPGLPVHGELKAQIVSKPKPTEAPDPRPSLFRNIPPYGGGIG
jgi:hypothetical protein